MYTKYSFKVMENRKPKGYNPLKPSIYSELILDNKRNNIKISIGFVSPILIGALFDLMDFIFP
jgi:hypothetical protein